MRPSKYLVPTLLLLAECLTLTAIGEQIVFQGEHYLCTLLAFASATLALLLGLRSERHAPTSVSRASWAVTPLAALAAFGILADRDRGRHLAMAGEEVISMGILPPVLLSIALLLQTLPLLRSPRTQVPETILRSLTLSIVAVSLCAVFFGGIEIGGRALSTQHQLLLAPLAVVAMLSAFLRSRLGLGWFDFRHSTSIVSIALLGTVGSTTLSLRNSSCPESSPPYEVSSTLIVDLLSAEDPLFFQHSGVDFHRIRQAIKETLTTEQFGRGGSTIPMQLAKVCYLSQEKTLFRKASQIVLGAVLEHRNSKAELLYRYLENVPFAPAVVGLQAASEHFYGVTPAQLNREQEITLVKTIFNPAEFGPNTQGDPQASRLRSAVIRGLGRRYCVSFRRNFLETPDIKVVFKPCQ
jgi:hypothetical protein